MLRKRHALATLGLLIAGALIANPVPAQTQGQEPAQDPQPSAAENREITGTVVSITGEMLVIRADDGTRTTLIIDPQSSLPADLVSGEKVSITYHADAADPTRLMIAEVRMDEPSGELTAQAETRSTLPQAASPLPWVALAGVLALAGAALLGRRRRAHAEC